MKKRKEISLLGALIICAVALALHKMLKLNELEESNVTDAKSNA